jgi:hypothetical protein
MRRAGGLCSGAGHSAAGACDFDVACHAGFACHAAGDEHAGKPGARRCAIGRIA